MDRVKPAPAFRRAGRFLAALVLVAITGLRPCGGQETVPAPEIRNLETILQKVKAREKTLRTFVARLTQVTDSRLLKEPLVSKARIYFDSRGKILIRFSSPRKVEMLLTKSSLVIHNLKTETVRRRFLGRNFMGRYFGVGRPLSDLRRLYRLELVDKTGAPGYTLFLSPIARQLKTRVSRLKVVIDPHAWLPVIIEIQRPNGDQTGFRLDYLTIDQPLPAGIFDIKLPAESRGDH